MSKRSRKYFESYEEFNRLCDEVGIRSPPSQKRKISEDGATETVNHNNNKASTPQAHIKQSVLTDSLSPSPPSLLSPSLRTSNDKHDDVIMTEKRCDEIFDHNLFFIASVGARNKRTGIRKHWSDLTKNRVKVFNELILKNGGQILENLDDFHTNHATQSLIIVVSENIKRNDFDLLFDEQMQEKKQIAFVIPSFITSSLKRKRKLSSKSFQPKCLKAPPVNKPTSNDKEEKEDITPEIKENITNKNEKKSDGQKQDWLDRNKHKFACQISNDGQSVNYNGNITNILDEMQDIYGCLGDKWREYGYKKANGFIKKYPHKIRTKNDIKQLMKMKGFSNKLAEKVKEIVNTGSLRKLNELKAMPQIKTIKLFSNIFGVGHITAQKWYNLGLRTLDDVKNTEKFNIKLQQRQIIGLKYYDDLLIKIPRSEMREIEKFVKVEINKLCSECIVTICGSYRRGKLKSGDIDVLVTHSSSEKTNGLLTKVTQRFYDIGFLVDDLSVPSGHSKHKDDHDSYMGVCKLLDPDYKYYRHIDIKIYKPEHYCFAVLYFTGSDHFNRSMRYFAKKKGFTLSDTHLAPAIRMNNSKIFTFTQKAIKCTTEQDIFHALGLKYIKPTERNTYENFGSSFNETSDDNQAHNEQDKILSAEYTP